jgi:hypothetical protein
MNPKHNWQQTRLDISTRERPLWNGDIQVEAIELVVARDGIGYATRDEYFSLALDTSWPKFGSIERTLEGVVSPAVCPTLFDRCKGDSAKQGETVLLI